MTFIMQTAHRLYRSLPLPVADTTDEQENKQDKLPKAVLRSTGQHLKKLPAKAKANTTRFHSGQVSVWEEKPNLFVVVPLRKKRNKESQRPYTRNGNSEQTEKSFPQPFFQFFYYDNLEAIQNQKDRNAFSGRMQEVEKQSVQSEASLLPNQHSRGGIRKHTQLRVRGGGRAMKGNGTQTKGTTPKYQSWGWGHVSAVQLFPTL